MFIVKENPEFKDLHDPIGESMPMVARAYKV